ncbi:basic proline-rich protein-like [Lutra lutra]|uniref:basic proline-rich protein-like n=1 Tax=Lutra lutra TaxID=9657 RepID=UPI001FD5B99E|nr:basic proline-rich protein-like [Lutra lutra]
MYNQRDQRIRPIQGGRSLGQSCGPKEGSQLPTPGPSSQSPNPHPEGFRKLPSGKEASTNRADPNLTACLLCTRPRAGPHDATETRSMCVSIHGNVPVKCETNPAQPEGTRPRSQLAASAPPHHHPWAQGQGHCLVDLRHPGHPGRRARPALGSRTSPNGRNARPNPAPRPPPARAPPARLPSPGPERGAPTGRRPKPSGWRLEPHRKSCQGLARRRGHLAAHPRPRRRPQPRAPTHSCWAARWLKT